IACRCACLRFFFFMILRPPSATLFPYTTLFRSLRDVEIVEEAADLGCDGEPALAVGGQLLERQPVPIADLDGVAATPGREQTQRSEERRVGKGWCGGWGGGGDGEVIVTGVIAAD